MSLENKKKEKLKYYPEGVQFTETSAKYSLQSMLNHRITIIINMIDLNESFKEQILYVKIGADSFKAMYL